MLLKDKFAIVTGSNGGIGRAILETFAKNGANIIACARVESDDFLLNADRLRKQYGVQIWPVYFDFGDKEALKHGIGEVISITNQIDILVNNAGIASGAMFNMMSMQSIREVFEINFFSQIPLIQLVARLMSKKKSGSIINIGSTAGLIGSPGTIAYGSSKSALMYLTKALASELGPYSVRVNAVAPGVVETSMFNQMEARAREKLLSTTSLEKFGQPENVADLALFLGSNLSQHITGQIIRIDGGYY